MTKKTETPESINLWKIAESVEQNYRELHDETVYLDDKVRIALNALNEYRDFQKKFSEKTFEVSLVEAKSPDGELVLKPFDWSSLDKG